MKKFLFGLTLALVLPLMATGASAAADTADTTASPLAPQAEAVFGLIEDQVEALYDHYATYYDPDEYRMMIDSYEGTFGGVGIYMLNENEEVVVYSVAPNTPAAESSIVAGDIILAVDGAALDGLDATDAALLIRGEIGSTVTLTLRRAVDGATYTVALTRGEIVTESVTGENLPDVDHTAYIILYSFTEHTAEEFVDLYNQLRAERPVERLIIDLRSNNGGSFYAAINIANLFVPSGMTVVKEKTSSGMQEYTSTNGQLNGIDFCPFIRGLGGVKGYFHGLGFIGSASDRDLQIA